LGFSRPGAGPAEAGRFVGAQPNCGVESFARSSSSIGTIGATVRGAEGHLRGMAVVPSSQGHGVAQDLLDTAEAELIAAGCSIVTLDTTAPLARAIRFYERNGYTRSGVVSDFFGMRLYEFRKVLVRSNVGAG